MIRTVGVVGGGTMGHGIAQLFATHNLKVILADSSESALRKAEQQVRDNLKNMVEIKYLSLDDVEGIAGNLTYTTDLDKLGTAEFITEAVFEDLDLKRDLFQKLDAKTAASVVIASNTSSFDINEINEKVKHPERVIGTHWFHPPQITPCVEIIPSDQTDPTVTKQTISLLESIGKAPTLCKSAPGFVANRIQYALVSEALAIVSEGLATPDQVDRIVKTSFGFRLSAFGPLEVCDQAGLDVYSAIFRYFYSVFKRDVFKPPAILEEMVKKGRHGLKNGKGFYEYGEGAGDKVRKERDRKLYDRLKLFQAERETPTPS